MPPTHRVRPPLRQDESLRSGNDAGFTVLEALVAFVLFAVTSGAAVTAIVTATRTSNTSRDRVNASHLALQDIQQARSLRDSNYPTAPSSVYPKTVKLGSKSYTVRRTINSACPATVDANNRAVAWRVGDATAMRVTSTVTWNGNTTGVSVTTEIAC